MGITEQEQSGIGTPIRAAFATLPIEGVTECSSDIIGFEEDVNQAGTRIRIGGKEPSRP